MREGVQATVGYYVLLPNLYYRAGRDTIFGPRVLITVIPERIATRGMSRRYARGKLEVLSHDQASGHIGLIRNGEATAERTAFGIQTGNCYCVTYA